jgi:hypothetical protein
MSESSDNRTLIISSETISSGKTVLDKIDFSQYEKVIVKNMPKDTFDARYLRDVPKVVICNVNNIDNIEALQDADYLHLESILQRPRKYVGKNGEELSEEYPALNIEALGYVSHLCLNSVRGIEEKIFLLCQVGRLELRNLSQPMYYMDELSEVKHLIMENVRFEGPLTKGSLEYVCLDNVTDLRNMSNMPLDWLNGILKVKLMNIRSVKDISALSGNLSVELHGLQFLEDIAPLAKSPYVKIVSCHLINNVSPLKHVGNLSLEDLPRVTNISGIKKENVELVNMPGLGIRALDIPDDKVEEEEGETVAKSDGADSKDKEHSNESDTNSNESDEDTSSDSDVSDIDYEDSSSEDEEKETRKIKQKEEIMAIAKAMRGVEAHFSSEDEELDAEDIIEIVKKPNEEEDSSEKDSSKKEESDEKKEKKVRKRSKDKRSSH